MKKIILAFLIVLNLAAQAVAFLPLIVVPVLFWNQYEKNKNEGTIRFTPLAGSDTIYGGNLQIRNQIGTNP